MNKMLMSVAMATVTPGEPAVTFCRSRLMIRRPELSAVCGSKPRSGNLAHNENTLGQVQ